MTDGVGMFQSHIQNAIASAGERWHTIHNEVLCDICAPNNGCTYYRQPLHLLALAFLNLICLETVILATQNMPLNVNYGDECFGTHYVAVKSHGSS